MSIKKIIIIICLFCILDQKNGAAKEKINLDDVNKIENKIMQENESSERNKIEKEINNHNRNNSDTKQSKMILFENDKENNVYDIKKAYCVKLLKDFWLTSYFEGEKLDNNISQDIQWKVPYQRSNGENGLATFAKENENYVWLGESLGEQQEQIPPSNEIIAQIVVKEGIKPENILKIELLYSQMYKLTLVNIKTKEKGYIIPYAEFPESLQSTDQKYQIINGEIYEIQDFMKEMNKIFDEQYLQLHPDQSSGLHYRQNNVRWISLTIEIIMIIFIGSFICRRLRVRKARNL